MKMFRKQSVKGSQPLSAKGQPKEIKKSKSSSQPILSANSCKSDGDLCKSDKSDRLIQQNKESVPSFSTPVARSNCISRKDQEQDNFDLFDDESVGVNVLDYEDDDTTMPNKKNTTPSVNNSSNKTVQKEKQPPGSPDSSSKRQSRSSSIISKSSAKSDLKFVSRKLGSSINKKNAVADSPDNVHNKGSSSSSITSKSSVKSNTAKCVPKRKGKRNSWEDFDVLDYDVNNDTSGLSTNLSTIVNSNVNTRKVM